jgi:hypothetical protein
MMCPTEPASITIEAARRMEGGQGLTPWKPPQTPASAKTPTPPSPRCDATASVEQVGLLLGKRTREAHAVRPAAGDPHPRRSSARATRRKCAPPSMAAHEVPRRPQVAQPPLGGADHRANLLFTSRYALDIQVLEGALTASRFIGFHLIDLNSALQVMLAHKHIITNLVIGTLTVATIWMLLGGRTFCSWVCPYHLSPNGPRSCTCGWRRRSWSPTRA